MEDLESTQPETTLAEAEAESSAEGAEEGTANELVAEEVTSIEIVAESVEDDAPLRATLEAIVYVTDEPLTLQQLAAALAQPIDKLKRVMDDLVAEYDKSSHGLSIREVAGGYKMATKAEHHEAVRAFVKKLTPPLKLSLAALETLAVIAYKQPVTAPEIMEIRGVQGAGVLKTLLDRKLIQESGRKKVVGQPILYKTTKEFLVQFGLKDLGELPTLKEFEELGRMELVEEMSDGPVSEASNEGNGAAESAQIATGQEETSAVADAAFAEDSPTETPAEADAASEDAAGKHHA